MKIKLINAYPKYVDVKTPSGELAKDAFGRTIKEKRSIFRYAITEASPEEIDAYRQSAMRDGDDYYRETEDGKPIYFSTTYLGRNAEINHYVDTEGEHRFASDRTDALETEALIAAAPSLAAELERELITKMKEGGRYKPKPSSSRSTEEEEEEEEEEEKEKVDANAGEEAFEEEKED